MRCILWRVSATLAMGLLLTLPLAARAESATNEDVSWGLRLFEHYDFRPNITYYTADAYEAKLDVYMPRHRGQPRPTLMFFHGGGWMGGYTKDGNPFAFLPFLQLGWNVVNIEYR